MRKQDDGGTAANVPPSVDCREAGASLIEVLIIFAIIGLIVSISAPVTATAVDASRARQGAAFLAARLRFARDG